MRTMRWLLLLALLVSFGCASATAAPPTLDVTGTWTGTWICTGFGAGEAWATLRQSGAKVTGELRFNGEIDLNPGGPVEGTIEGNVLTFRWATRDATGLGQFTVRGEDMSGSTQVQERLQFNLVRAK